ncbi:MAG TPA: hypothetical protein VFU71_18105 [Burkholderiaceae bacterium]|nr:hypothetical protein [Burkholderiaceae bacterium]
MALVACQECKKQISSQAKTCPLCGAKQRRTSVVTWLVLGLIVIFVLKAVWNSGEERAAVVRAEASGAALKQRLAANAEAERAKLKTDCEAARATKVGQYQAHTAKRQFKEAWLVLDDCAKATGDAELRKMADTARIADLRDVSNKASNTTSARLTALETLQRDYPQLYDTKLAEQEQALRKKLMAEVAAEKRRQGVRIGMSKEDVLASSWGRPQKINRSTYSWGTTEQWVYGGGYLYFKNDVLESIQN